jgi:hypothetical protein
VGVLEGSEALGLVLIVLRVRFFALCLCGMRFRRLRHGLFLCFFTFHSSEPASLPAEASERGILLSFFFSSHHPTTQHQHRHQHQPINDQKARPLTKTTKASIITKRTARNGERAWEIRIFFLFQFFSLSFLLVSTLRLEKRPIPTSCLTAERHEDIDMRGFPCVRDGRRTIRV